MDGVEQIAALYKYRQTTYRLTFAAALFNNCSQLFEPLLPKALEEIENIPKLDSINNFELYCNKYYRAALHSDVLSVLMWLRQQMSPHKDNFMTKEGLKDGICSAARDGTFIFIEWRYKS